MNQGGNCVICKIVGVLVVLGAINWGLVGAFNIDMVATLFGALTTPTRAVYILIGIAGVLKLISCFKLCPCCKKP